MDAKASIMGEISLNSLKVHLWNKLERDIARKDCRGSCIQKQVMESTSLAMIKACCQSSEILASVAQVVPRISLQFLLRKAEPDVFSFFQRA